MLEAEILAHLLPVLFGMVVGISLGLTGGGGSIFAVPLLVYGLHIGMREAVVVSLAVVGASSLLGALMRLRGGQLEIGTGVLFALAGFPGAPLGAALGRSMPEPVLLIGFGLLMVVVGVRMWRRTSSSGVPDAPGRCPCERTGEGNRLRLGPRCLAAILGAGFLAGLFSGLFGVGGGFIIVPALILTTGMATHRAVATSLLVIALISVAAILSQGSEALGTIPWRLVLLFLGGALAGMLVGGRVRDRLSEQALSRGFAIAVVVVAALVLTRSAMELPV